MTGAVGVQLCDTCGEVRRETALVPVDGGGWRCAEPCRKPGGRPPIGPPVLIRMPVELRAAVEALALPGEKLAATARRLLTAAVTASSSPGGPGMAAMRRPEPDSSATGKRVVLAEDLQGSTVVVGPVFTDKGIAEVEQMISAKVGWSVTSPARIVSKAQVEWA